MASPAVDRGMELFTKVPIGEIPDEALIYSSFMCKKYMMCSEVVLTAYCVYAQLHEGLACDDETYAVDDTHRANWRQAQETLRVNRNGRIQVVSRLDKLQ